jgi:hypothetical protein
LEDESKREGKGEKVTVVKKENRRKIKMVVVEVVF